MQPRLAGTLYAVSAAVMWGTLGIAYRVGESMGASGAWMAVGRPLLPAIVSLALLAAGRGRFTRWSLVVGSVLAVFIPVYLWAVEEAGAALASILLYTAPVWVAVAGYVAGEPPGALGLTAVGLGVTGAVLIASEGVRLGSVVGIAYGLASGIIYAAYIVTVRYAARRGASVLELGLHSQPVAAVGSLAVLRPPATPTPLDTLWMLYTGFVTMLAPYLLNAKALSLMEAHRVAVISLVEPLTATLLAVTVLRESLTILQALGAVLILSATLLAAKG